MNRSFDASGTVPLTVNFDGSGSYDADGDTIASHTFDFADGPGPVTQSTPTISHTYNFAGNYAAQLTVSDSRGQVSTNTATVLITVSPANTDPDAKATRQADAHSKANAKSHSHADAKAA